MDKQELYRKIPRMDSLLENQSVLEMKEKHGKGSTVRIIREVLEELRRMIAEEKIEDDFEEWIVRRAAEKMDREHQPHFRRVINGTGIILHTNLGRAPMGNRMSEYLARLMAGYSNLEFDLCTGERGSRWKHFEQLICRITKAEAAVAVNNNAAAILLILTALAQEKEVIVSRGELVEVGGKFRIPDVMEQSRAILKEVGTTNRTRIEDYEKAAGQDTAALMKVHTSNYKIIGFSEAVEIRELAELAQAKGIPLIADLGSGVFVPLEEYGMEHEPMVQEAIADGAHLVCFSGDKLLGGPQAGIIAGKKEYVEKIRKHPLMRALRPDKCTVAALEYIFMQYLDQEKVWDEVPALHMLSRSLFQLKNQSKKLCRELKEKGLRADCQLCTCFSMTGGGSLPAEQIESFGISVSPWNLSAQQLKEKLLAWRVPVIGKLEKDRWILDLRTVFPEEMEELKEALLWACANENFTVDRK